MVSVGLIRTFSLITVTELYLLLRLISILQVSGQNGATQLALKLQLGLIRHVNIFLTTTIYCGRMTSTSQDVPFQSQERVQALRRDYNYIGEQHFSVCYQERISQMDNKKGGISFMSIGILLIISSIIVFFTLCLCSISKKETPRVGAYQDPEQMPDDLKIGQLRILDSSTL